MKQKQYSKYHRDFAQKEDLWKEKKKSLFSTVYIQEKLYLP